MDKQSLCIDVLVNGYCQAYVDFFYLTHRPEPTGTEEKSEDAGIPPEKLPFVKSHLADAEAARRQGDTKAVFASYKELAGFFTDLKDQRTAVYFWEKCLEISRLTSDMQGEAEATCALGEAQEQLHEVTAAVGFYEKLLRLGETHNDAGIKQQANEHLVVAYQSMAAETEAAGDLTGALAIREKSFEASAGSGDSTKQGQAHYELGLAHEQLEDDDNLQKAATHYQQFLQLCEGTQNTEGQGAACFALARVHLRLQDSPAALTFLQNFLQLAQSSGKPQAQAEACCSLGVLYNQQGDFANAVQYLERFFELARSIGDKALLDKARTYLGIARGNAVLPAYMHVVTHDLDALLRWKNRRLPFSDAARA
jgi:tetratricopeptide (TPR) repeat protein